MATVNGAVKIESATKPGGIHSPSPAVDIDMTARVKRSPAMRVLPHHSNGQLIGEPVVQTQTDSPGGEVVARGVPIAIHVDKVTKPGYPDTPAVFGCMLQDRFHHCFGGFSVCVGSIFQIHRSA